MSKITIPGTCFHQLERDVEEWVRAQFGPNPEYNPDLQPTIDRWGLPWFRSAAVVVNSEGKILLMHEGRVQVKKIKDPVLKSYYRDTKGCSDSTWVDGDGGWNLPSGRLRSGEGESFEDAALREVKEESGHQIVVKKVLCVRKSDNLANLYIMPVYLAEDVSGPEHYTTAETMGIGWFSVEGIRALHDAGVLRSPDSVMSAIDAYEKHLKS